MKDRHINICRLFPCSFKSFLALLFLTPQNSSSLVSPLSSRWTNRTWPLIFTPFLCNICLLTLYINPDLYTLLYICSFWSFARILTNPPTHQPHSHHRQPHPTAWTPYRLNIINSLTSTPYIHTPKNNTPINTPTYFLCPKNYHTENQTPIRFLFSIPKSKTISQTQTDLYTQRAGGSRIGIST